uniref:G_PROTEIN_RECEP_F1_2 domain-containing protein n=1 Tax=Trichuris muris TaxID=70415 RepID=A0A5S6QRE8_TRIMR
MNHDLALERNESVAEVELRDRIVGSCILLLASFPGIALNMLVICLLLRKRTVAWNSTFPYYGMLMSRCASDLVILTIYAGYCVPVILFQRSMYGEIGERFIGWLRQFAYFSGLFHMVLIAVNRYFGVCQLNRYKNVFSVRNTGILISIGWIFGALVSAVNLLPQCQFKFLYRFNTWGYPLTYKCNVWIIGGDITVNVLALITLVIIYMKVFFQLKMLNKKFIHKTRQIQRRRLSAESQLAIEAVTMTVGLFAVWVAFIMIPLLTLNRWFLLGNSCLSVIYSSLCACLTYCCKKRLQRLFSPDGKTFRTNELQQKFNSPLLNMKKSTQELQQLLARLWNGMPTCNVSVHGAPEDS